MTESTIDNQEIVHKLHLVQEFITNIYNGRRQYKARNAFISNELDDLIVALEGKQK